MRRDEQFTFFEGVCIFTLVFIYHIFSEVLPTLLKDLGPASWMTHITSAVFALVYLWLFMLLYRRYEGMDFIQICDAVYGRGVSKLVQLVLLLYLALYSGSALNQVVETLQLYDYSNMGALQIDLVAMAAVAVIALYSVKGMAKTVSIFLPGIVLVILLILALSWRQYDVNLLNPLFGYGAGFTTTKSLYHLSKFNGIVLFAVVGGSFGSERRFSRTAMWGIIISSVLFTLVNICYAMAIPYSSAEDIQVGIVGLAQGNSNGRFLQRLESIYLIVDVLAILLLLGFGFLLLKKIYCSIFAIDKQHANSIIVPLAVIVVCVARTMGNVDNFKWQVRYLTRRYSGFLFLGITALTLLVSLLRRQKMGGRGLRTAALLLVPCLTMGLLSGCGNYREPDSEIFPIVLGYDKGEREQYRITLKFMTEGKSEAQVESKSTESGGEAPDDIMVFEAPSLDEGQQLLSTVMPRHISLLHIKMLVVSEEVAREGVGDIIVPLVRYNNVKPTMSFVVSAGSAYELITGKNPVLTDPVQMDLELIQEASRQSTYYINTTLSEFLYSYKSTYGDGLAIYGNLNRDEFDGEPDSITFGRPPVSFRDGYLAGELPVAGNRQLELAGMAVFQGERMVGTLNTQDCQTLAFLRGDFQTTTLTLPDLLESEDKYVALHIRRVQPVKVKTAVGADGVAEIQLGVVVNGKVGISQNDDENYISDPEQRRQLAEYCSALMEERSRALLDMLQTEYRADVLQLGRNMARNFMTIQEWEAFDWDKSFPEARIDVDFEIHL